MDNSDAYRVACYYDDYVQYIHVLCTVPYNTIHISHCYSLSFLVIVTHTRFSGTTRVRRYQKGKTNLDFTDARDSEWLWHQLGHIDR